MPVGRTPETTRHSSVCAFYSFSALFALFTDYNFLIWLLVHLADGKWPSRLYDKVHADRCCRFSRSANSVAEMMSNRRHSVSNRRVSMIECEGIKSADERWPAVWAAGHLWSVLVYQKYLHDPNSDQRLEWLFCQKVYHNSSDYWDRLIQSGLLALGLQNESFNKLTTIGPP